MSTQPLMPPDEPAPEDALLRYPAQPAPQVPEERQLDPAEPDHQAPHVPAVEIDVREEWEREEAKPRGKGS